MATRLPSLGLWYELDEVRQILRDCRASPPETISPPQSWKEDGPVVTQFSREDPRVHRLHAIVRQHFAPLFDAKVSSDVIKAAGLEVSVDYAIDAVLDTPRCGHSSDAYFMSRLPTIDLSERAAA